MPILSPAPAWKPNRSTDIVLWHGCTGKDRIEIEANGIDFSMSRLALDFGRGFYTTTSKRQARHWAWLRYYDPRSVKRSNQPVILRFQLSRMVLSSMKSLSFVRSAYDNLDFWSLVQHCRQSVEPDLKRKTPGVIHDHAGPVSESGQNWYDVVSGPAAASWKQRAALADADQFSFHTQLGVKTLNALIKSAASGYQWFPVP